MTPEAKMHDLTGPEVAEARAALEAARDRMLAATNGLSEAQLNYTPACGGWSPAGILEHAVVVQELVLGPVAQAMTNVPESSNPEMAVIDAIVWEKFTDRSRKFPSPPSTQPSGRWTPAEARERLSANTRRLVEYVESTPGLRRRCLPSPPLKAITDGSHQLMDGYQWVVAVAFHTDRHTRQILEVKAEPGFPR